MDVGRLRLEGERPAREAEHLAEAVAGAGQRRETADCGRVGRIEPDRVGESSLGGRVEGGVARAAGTLLEREPALGELRRLRRAGGAVGPRLPQHAAEERAGEKDGDGNEDEV